MYSAPSDAKYSYIAKWYRSYSTWTSWTGPGTSQGGVAAREPSVTLTNHFQAHVRWPSMTGGYFRTHNHPLQRALASD